MRKKLTQIIITRFWNLKYPTFTKSQEHCLKFISTHGFNSALIEKQKQLFINTNTFNRKYCIKY